MSKKRLYEIAKEVGVESKVVVAKAQELGLSVKSHSSSVEEADANRITSSLKGGTAKAESKPAPKATPTPKEEKVAPKVDKVPVAKSAPAKETSKAEVKEAPATPKKPQSRNFKAEREARAKAEAERRQNGGGRDNRNRNRNQQGNDQGKRQNNDRRNQNGNGQGNRNNGNRGNNSNRDRNFKGKQRNDQGRNKRNDAARNNQAGPRIDFKARAAALKAEQNAEYSRQSETRFREEKAAEQRRAKEQEKARKEKQQAEVAAQKAVAEAKPAPKPAPVAQPAPAAQAQDTRRKKARPDKSRDNRRENEDGPKQTRNNKWNNQNQVRNQRNSNWNKNKNKKGKNNRGNSAPKPVTERKFHELPKEFEYTEGMTVAEIAKRIKREPAEIVKKLFMMGVMATQNQSLDGDTIELLMVDYGIEATKKEEVDNADIERFFVDEDYLNKDAMVERAPVVTIMGHVDHGKTTLLDTLRNSRVAPERVIGELAEHGVISTAWGGDSEFVEISAKFGQNIEELLETVLLVAEVEELKADPTVRAIGTVIEARLDKGKGAVATLLVQQGTLHVQDPIVVGNTFGRVRAMTNDLGRRIKTAAPSTPVSITGLNEAPMAGDHFAVYEDEKAARAAGEERAKRALMKQRQQTHRVSLDNLFDTLKAGELKTVNVIIKADVQGSVEALAASLLKIDVEGVRVNVVHSAVGAINESDITLAEASDAVVIGFNVRPTPQARQQAETDEVEIRLHSIIYKVIEEIEDAMKGMLDPEFEEKVIGEAIIRETFKVSKVGTIGGFMVTSGKITRDSSARVIRDGVVIFDGKLASLKHFKDDVKEVGNAQEGGLMIENYNDIKVDDVIEAYIMEEIKR